jgi:hypothetical protein
VDSHRSLGWKYCFHLRDGKISRANSRSCCSYYSHGLQTSGVPRKSHSVSKFSNFKFPSNNDNLRRLLISLFRKISHFLLNQYSGSTKVLN